MIVIVVSHLRKAGFTPCLRPRPTAAWLAWQEGFAAHLQQELSAAGVVVEEGMNEAGRPFDDACEVPMHSSLSVQLYNHVWVVPAIVTKQPGAQAGGVRAAM